jgi:hypothetical protein
VTHVFSPKAVLGAVALALILGSTFVAPPAHADDDSGADSFDPAPGSMGAASHDDDSYKRQIDTIKCRGREWYEYGDRQDALVEFREGRESVILWIVRENDHGDISRKITVTSDCDRAGTNMKVTDDPSNNRIKVRAAKDGD